MNPLQADVRSKAATFGRPSWNATSGAAAGQMRGGRHIRYQEAPPLANLHLPLLDKVGVRLDKFMDSSGKVDGLFEPLGI